MFFSLVSELVCTLEIAFILDSSESAKGLLFDREKAFVRSFSKRVAQMQVSDWHLKTRMALIYYSSSVHIDQHFKDWQDHDVFLSRLEDAIYIGQGTYSTFAISNATQLFTSETKEQSVRVALLMTDGVDHPRNPDIMMAVAEAKGQNIKIFTIGLSNLAKHNMNSAKLRVIASSPAQQYFHSLTDPKLEERLLQQLVRHSLHLSDSLGYQDQTRGAHIINKNKLSIQNLIEYSKQKQSILN